MDLWNTNSLVLKFKLDATERGPAGRAYGRLLQICLMFYCLN